MRKCVRALAVAAVAGVLSVAAVSPAAADHQSPRKHDAKCAKAPPSSAKLQAKRERIANHKPLSDPAAEAERQVRIAKLDAKIAAGKTNCG